MSDVDRVFTGSIPDVYDTYLVPLIFESYASDLAERVGEWDPHDVLELAAGSGVVTRALAPVLGEDVHYVVTDLNGPMLDRAAKSQPGSDSIEWRVADAQSLPFADDSFDVVVCQFGCMFFPDRALAYREARRVLRPGGRFVFNMWDRIEENDFAMVVTSSLAELWPDDAPQFLARTPHGHYDPLVFRSELSNAGFGAVRIDTVDDVSRARDATVPAVAYCMGTPLRTEIEARSQPDLDAATDYAAAAIADRFGTGPVEGRIRGFVVTAT